MPLFVKDLNWMLITLSDLLAMLLTVVQTAPVQRGGKGGGGVFRSSLHSTVDQGMFFHLNLYLLAVISFVIHIALSYEQKNFVVALA